MGKLRTRKLSIFHQSPAGDHPQSGLSCTHDDLKNFVEQVRFLGHRLGPILFQTPPSLAFDSARVENLFSLLRSIHEGPIAVEPRHVNWFSGEADQLLNRLKIARVAADPAPAPAGKQPGGTKLISYYRLHGSPRKYYSSYDDEELSTLAESVHAKTNPGDVWVIFDNTASGAAAADALRLQSRLGPYSKH